MSAGQLQDKGYEITMKKGACETYDPLRGAIAIVQMSANRLLPLKIQTAHSCLLAELKNYLWLWHFHYGHLNFGGLKTLQQNSMIISLPQIAFRSQVCEECC